MKRTVICLSSASVLMFMPVCRSHLFCFVRFLISYSVPEKLAGDSGCEFGVGSFWPTRIKKKLDVKFEVFSLELNHWQWRWKNMWTFKLVIIRRKKVNNTILMCATATKLYLNYVCMLNVRFETLWECI